MYVCVQMGVACWLKASSQAIKLSERSQELARASEEEEPALMDSAPAISVPVHGSSPMPMEKEKVDATSSQVRPLRPC